MVETENLSLEMIRDYEEIYIQIQEKKIEITDEKIIRKELNFFKFLREKKFSYASSELVNIIDGAIFFRKHENVKYFFENYMEKIFESKSEKKDEYIEDFARSIRIYKFLKTSLLTGDYKIFKYLLIQYQHLISEYEQKGLSFEYRAKEIWRTTDSRKALFDPFVYTTLNKEYFPKSIAELLIEGGLIELLKLMMVFYKASKDELNKFLIIASGCGNIDIVKYLIELGAPLSVNWEYDNNKGKVLEEAIKSNNLELVKYLVEKGADEKQDNFYSRNYHYCDYLLNAYRNRNKNMIEYLKENVDVMLRLEEEDSVDLELFSFMMDLNIKIECSRYSLMYYLKSNGGKVIEKILSDNKDLEIDDCLFWYALELGDEKIIELFLEKYETKSIIDMEKFKNRLFTELLISSPKQLTEDVCRGGFVGCLEVLIDKNISIKNEEKHYQDKENLITIETYPALRTATIHNQVEIIKVLSRYFNLKDLKNWDSENKTVVPLLPNLLILACENKSYEVFEYFLDTEFSFEELNLGDGSDKMKKIIKHLLKDDQKKIVEKLMEVLASQKYSYFELFISFLEFSNYNDLTKEIYELLEHKIFYWDELSMAVKYGNLEMVEFIIDKAKNLNAFSPLELAISLDKKEVVVKLLKAGAVPNYYSNILIEIVKNNNIEMTKLLLEAGADPNYKIFDKKTYKNYKEERAIHYAVNNQNFEIVKLLLEFGAIIDDSDIFFSYEQCDKKIVKLLLECPSEQSREITSHLLYPIAQNDDLEFFEIVFEKLEGALEDGLGVSYDIDIMNKVLKSTKSIEILKYVESKKLSSLIYGSNLIDNAIQENNIELLKYFYDIGCRSVNSEVFNVEERIDNPERKEVFNFIIDNYTEFNIKALLKTLDTVEIFGYISEKGIDLLSYGEELISNAVEKENLPLLKYFYKLGCRSSGDDIFYLLEQKRLIKEYYDLSYRQLISKKNWEILDFILENNLKYTLSISLEDLYMENRIETIKKLIETKRINLNLGNLLKTAVEYKSAETLICLLEAGVKLEGWSEIFMAQNNGDYEIVEILLNQGNLKEIASKNNFLDVLDKIISDEYKNYEPINEEGEKDQIKLRDYVRSKNYDKVKAILKKGLIPRGEISEKRIKGEFKWRYFNGTPSNMAFIDTKERDWWSFQEALLNNDEKMLDILVRYHIDISNFDFDYTLLEKGSLKTLKLFINAGYKIPYSDLYGSFPTIQNLEMVEYLSNIGAKFDKFSIENLKDEKLLPIFLKYGSTPEMIKIQINEIIKQEKDWMEQDRLDYEFEEKMKRMENPQDYCDGDCFSCSTEC